MHDHELAKKESRPNRRELIIKSLKLGSAAYVVPMVLSSATPALAQVTNPACVGAACDNFIPCNNNQSCFCFTLASGGGFCSLDFFCDSVSQCGAGNTCPAGFVCAVNTCCEIPVCAPISGTCPPPGVNVPTPSFTSGSAARR
jgi:hypothetical protein